MRLIPYALLGAALAAPAAAETIQFSALLKGEAGYGTNPHLRPGVTAGSGFGSGTFTPRFFYQTARSTTTVDGEYSREQYLSRFGSTDSLRATLSRTDQLTARLQSSLGASYNTTNKVTLADPSQLVDQDPLNIGRRTYRSTGQYELQWQATAKDQLTYGAQIAHLSYGGSQNAVANISTSPYTQTSVNVGYNRTVDARTSVGVQASVSSTKSKLYPDSRTIQPSLTLKRQLNAVWTLDGHVGVVLQHIDGPFANSSTSLGYGLNLCGAYSRTHLCLSAQRQTSASGLGSLRTISGITATVSHDLTEHSRVNANVNYSKSSSTASQGPIGTPSSRAFLTNAEYDRDLTQRLSAGFGGTYQWRSSAIIGAGHSIAGTVHVTAKLGRM